MGTYTQHLSATPATTSQSAQATKRNSSSYKLKPLKWRKGNAKLRDDTIHLSIPAGWTCRPWATECLAFAQPESGKITDGKEQKFRCYAATMEAIYPAHRDSLWDNYDTIASVISDPIETYNTLLNSLIPEIMKYQAEHNTQPKIRIFGTSGDFFHKNLYIACLALAQAIDPIRIYWYTKAIPLWIKYKDKITTPNLEQNASLGGRFDNLIWEHKLKYARVVYSPKEAKQLSLPIDKRDELASNAGGPFAILLHGTQPKGSVASKALSKLRKEGIGGYSRK